MSRVPTLSSPFLLGFEEIERALDRVAKAADGYPPYNVERLPAAGTGRSGSGSRSPSPASRATSSRSPSKRTSW